MKQYLDQLGVEYLWGRIKRNFANLSNSGKVPASLLPSYVDDVEEYESLSSFPSLGEEGKIYVAKNTNLTYRWSGSTYVEISLSIALGDTSNTAYPGDKGKLLEDNLDAEINRTKEAEATITSNLNNHISDYHNPHKVTKALIGLSDVDNTADINKPISTATLNALNLKADANKYLPLTGGTLTGDLTSPKYVKTGGTNEQILLADGTVATPISADTLNLILT